MRRNDITTARPERLSALVTLGIVGVAAALTAGCGEPPPPTMPPATQERAAPPAEQEPIAPPAEAEPVQPAPPPAGEF